MSKVLTDDIIPSLKEKIDDAISDSLGTVNAALTKLISGDGVE